MGFCQKFSCSDLIEDVVKSQVKLLPRALTITKRFIAIGNADSTKNSRITEIFDPITKEWSKFKNLTFEKIGFCSVILDENLYVLGGGYPRNRNIVKTVQKYNFSTKEWTNLADMNNKRVFFAAAVLDNYIYVAGGSKLSSVER